MLYLVLQDAGSIIFSRKSELCLPVDEEDELGDAPAGKVGATRRSRSGDLSASSDKKAVSDCSGATVDIWSALMQAGWGWNLHVIDSGCLRSTAFAAARLALAGRLSGMKTELKNAPRFMDRPSLRC